jgi:DNA-binding beta-propeller fold protein YncE
MNRRFLTLLLASCFLVAVSSSTDALAKKKKESKEAKENPYAEFVWPPPPDDPRIQLTAVISGRADVEATSKLKRSLLGANPQSAYDFFKKPFGVDFDAKGRILLTDTGTAALIRLDRNERRMDVFGTRGNLKLSKPLGISVATDGTIYVADAGIKKVLAFDEEGNVTSAYGRQGELVNPTDTLTSADGKRLFVADSKAHKIVVFDLESGALVSSFGKEGQGEGEFKFPTSLARGPEGSLFVVDQINSRLQQVTEGGEYIDSLGALGVGFGNLVRPKDVAVDDDGFLYVTDNAFNNVQIFDADFTLLTFLGEGGTGPGRFHGASGVAVHGQEIAVVDQQGHRLQIFRYIAPRTEE